MMLLLAYLISGLQETSSRLVKRQANTAADTTSAKVAGFLASSRYWNIVPQFLHEALVNDVLFQSTYK